MICHRCATFRCRLTTDFILSHWNISPTDINKVTSLQALLCKTFRSPGVLVLGDFGIFCLFLPWTAGPIWIQFSAAPPPNICLQNGTIPIQISRRDEIETEEIETDDLPSKSKNVNFFIRCWERINFSSGKIDINVRQNVLTDLTLTSHCYLLWWTYWWRGTWSYSCSLDEILLD